MILTRTIRRTHATAKWHMAARLTLFGWAVALFAATPTQAETWTSLRGTRSIEAEMVGLWGDQLVLALQDGRRVTVALNDLRAESRIKAQRLASSSDASRLARINELRSRADVAAAPAPDPLPQPPPAAPYVRPDQADVAAQFQAVDAQVRAGHAIAIFDAMPASYQAQLDELAKLGVAKINGLTLRSMVGSAHQLGDLIVTRQQWFFSHPRLDVSVSPTPEETQRLNDTILAFGGMLRAGLNPDSFDPSAMQSTPLRQWLLDRDAAMAPYVAELFRLNSVTPPEYAVEKAKGKGKGVSLTIATLEDESGEPVERTIPMTKVDDAMVPTAIADAWKTAIPNLKDEWEAAADGSILADPTTVVLLSSLDPLINPLAQAQNRGEFHTAMQPLIEVVTPLLESLQTNLSSRRRR
tara:strand:- start:27298 stop:28530 length:1233 start_codon:yes stop_codon:yes gene_type:complete